MLKIFLNKQTLKLLFIRQDVYCGLACWTSMIYGEEIALYSLKIEHYQWNSYLLRISESVF